MAPCARHTGNRNANFRESKRICTYSPRFVEIRVFHIRQKHYKIGKKQFLKYFKQLFKISYLSIDKFNLL